MDIDPTRPLAIEPPRSHEINDRLVRHYGGALHAFVLSEEFRASAHISYEEFRVNQIVAQYGII